MKERNNNLLAILTKANIEGKDVDNLKLAIKNSYIDSFYIGCKEN